MPEVFTERNLLCHPAGSIPPTCPPPVWLSTRPITSVPDCPLGALPISIQSEAVAEFVAQISRTTYPVEFPAKLTEVDIVTL